MTTNHKFYGVTPSDELKQTIISAVWHAAERELGAQQMIPCQNDSCIGEIPPFDLEQWKREHDDPDFTKRKHLAALRYANEAGQDPSPWVVNTRIVGQASWQEVADALGLNSRQAAHERYGEAVKRASEDGGFFQSKAAAK